MCLLGEISMQQMALGRSMEPSFLIECFGQYSCRKICIKIVNSQLKPVLKEHTVNDDLDAFRF